MKTEERLAKLLNAPPETVRAIDEMLSGKAYPEEHSLRLLKMSEAARRLNVSRQTIWRLCHEGRLRTVEIRNGRRAIPENELLRFVGVGK